MSRHLAVPPPESLKGRRNDVRRGMVMPLNNRAMRYVLVGAFALAGVLLYLLATASANTERFAQHYSLLLALNAFAAVAMLGVVGFLLVRLWRRRRAQVFGTGLAARLTLLFALMAIIPGTQYLDRL